MDKKEILIRLLKDGHISNEEFWLLADESNEINTKTLELHKIDRELRKHLADLEQRLQFVPAPNFAPIPYNPYSPFDPNNQFVVTC